jgi:hypothetical protein
MNKYILYTSVFLCGTSLLHAGFDPENASDAQRKAQVVKLREKVADGKNIKKNAAKLKTLEQLVATGDQKFMSAYKHSNAQEIVPVNTSSITNINNNNNAIVVDVSEAPSVLTLNNALVLRASCMLFMTDDAERTLNNIFTNYAHDLAIQLYEVHGDKFVKPFSQAIIGGVYGLVENCLLGAAGVKELVSAVKDLSGIKLTARTQVSTYAKELSSPVVDILRLKPLTDLINKHVIGPQIVGPTVAAAVDALNLGSVIRTQIFERLHDKLVSYHPQLLQRTKEQESLLISQKSALVELFETKEVDPRDVVLSQAISQTKSEVDVLQAKAQEEWNAKSWGTVFLDTACWNTSETQAALKLSSARLSELKSEQDAKKKLIQTRRNRLEQIESEITSLSNLIYAAENQPVASFDDRTLNKILNALSFIGPDFEKYTQPCPALQPSALSSVLTVERIGSLQPSALSSVLTVERVGFVPKMYLQFTGVTPAFLELKRAVSLEEFRLTIDHIGFLFDDSKNRAIELSETTFTPPDEQLEGKGWFGRACSYISSAVRGGLRSCNNLAVIKNNAQEAKDTVVGHASWIQNSAERLSQSLRYARMPFTLLFNTLKFTATTGAVNYVVRFVTGGALTQTNYLPGVTLAVIEEYHNLYPDHIPSLVGSCKNLVTSTFKSLKK